MMEKVKIQLTANTNHPYKAVTKVFIPAPVIVAFMKIGAPESDSASSISSVTVRKFLQSASKKRYENQVRIIFELAYQVALLEIHENENLQSASPTAIAVL